MKRILPSLTVAIAAVLTSCAVGAAGEPDFVAERGGEKVRLTNKECTHPQVVLRLTPEVAKNFRAASAVVSGQAFQACWHVVGNGAHLVYEDGDEGMVPLSDLKPDFGA